MAGSFRELSERIMDEYLSWDPALSTQVGWHKYDSKLRDPSRGALASQSGRCVEIAEELLRIPSGSLSGEDLIDRDLAVFILDLKRFENEELRLYEKASLACTEIGYSLFFLSARDLPEFRERMESITCRLEMVSSFLREAREVVKDPFRTWNEAALEAGREIPAMISGIHAQAKSEGLDGTLSERLKKATEEAVAAVVEHNRWMSEEVIPISSSRCTIAPSEYERYLAKRGYGVNTEEALEIGETYLKLGQAKISMIAKEIGPGGGASETLETMKSNHPKTFDAVLAEYRDSAEKAREFVVHRNLATIPEGERLVVAETPQFMRPMCPFAAQFEPGKFDGGRTGFFFVTPCGNRPEMLREHSYAAIANTAVHEGYPGHHLQGICSNTHPSHIRILVQAPDFSEGWGLYVEDMMISEGFNDNPLGRLANANDLMFRICRLVAETKLAKGEMTQGEAAELFVKECMMDPGAARTEARACTMWPTYYSSYFLGKLSVLQLKEDVQKILKGAFSLKFLHDALLCTGCLPMSFMRRGVALRIKEKYGLELPPQKESLYEFAMRLAGRN